MTDALVSRRFPARALLAVLCAAVCAAAPAAQTVAVRMDEYIRSYAEAGTFMGSVLVARRGEVLLSKGYGAANLAGKIANGPRTQFRLGSISKGFTAVAILQLQEQGKLSIEDPLSRFIPGFPGGEGIRIRHLLSHTSGIPDFILLPDAFNQMATPIGLDGLVALFAGEEREFPPGQRFSYSNSGFALCAKIIEAASGMGFAQYMKTRVLGPAGMTRSGCDFEDDPGGGDRAVGYHYSGEGYFPAPGWDTSRAAGCGSIYATTEDMLAWSRALSAGKVLGEASLRVMFAPTAESKGSYGLGWYLRDFLGRKRQYHGGYMFGFRGDFTRYPEEGVDIIVLSNVDQAGTRKMVEDLAAILFGAPWKAPEAWAAAKPDLARYAACAGLYDTSEIFGEGATMLVQAEGGRLWYQANTIYDSLGLPIHIYPISDRLFRDKTGEARYEFIMDASGKADAVEIGDSSESCRFPRLRQ